MQHNYCNLYLWACYKLFKGIFALGAGSSLTLHMNQHTITQKTQTYVTTLQPGAAAEGAEGKSCHLPVNDSHFIPTARPSVDVRNGAGGQRAAGETRPETPAGRKGRCM